MFVRLLKPVFDYKSGKIYDIEPGMARYLIASLQAKAVDSSAPKKKQKKTRKHKAMFNNCNK